MSTSQLANIHLRAMQGAMQVAKRIPFEEEPQYLLYARVAYVSAQVICLLINYFISLKVSRCASRP